MTRRLGLAILIGTIVAACAPPPPKQPDPTIAQVTLNAAQDANPDPTGRASPSVVFVYALKPGAPFQTASYDSLTGGELGDNAQSMERIARLVMVPGKSSKKIFELPPGTAAVGVAVAFRQIGTAKWRESAPVTANKVTLVNADLSSNQVSVSAVSAQ